MKTKFRPGTSLEGKKGIFLSSGLIITLSIMLFAFEWGKSDLKMSLPAGFGDPVNMIDELIQPVTPPKTEAQNQQKKLVYLFVPDPSVDDRKWDLWDPELGSNDKNPIYIPPMLMENPVEDTIDIRFIPYEDWPSFPGGDEARSKFLAANLIYPKLALQTGIQGMVVIEFIVEKDGSLTDITILKDIGGGCGAEGARVVKEMPKWSPGKQRNRPVKVRMRMPIRFKFAS